MSALARKHIWRSVVGAILLVGSAFWISNPLRWPDGAVHRWLLWKVPAGSDSTQLQSVAARSGWKMRGTWPGHQLHSDWGGIDGTVIVWIYLGGYPGFLRTDLDSFWAFDEQGRLKDVRVRRMIDGP
jgi:hypothetical protein